MKRVALMSLLVAAGCSSQKSESTSQAAKRVAPSSLEAAHHAYLAGDLLALGDRTGGWPDRVTLARGDYWVDVSEAEERAFGPVKLVPGVEKRVRDPHDPAKNLLENGCRPPVREAAEGGLGGPSIGTLLVSARTTLIASNGAVAYRWRRCRARPMRALGGATWPASSYTRDGTRRRGSTG